jgi:hypothetical protein
MTTPKRSWRDLFNPSGGVFAENIRATIGGTDTELRASLQQFGWVEKFPALIDENGVVLVGHRRLALAKELGIEPVIERLTLGTGDEADARRLKLALVSNIGSKPLTKDDRQRIAEHLYGEHEWTMERIAEALNVSQATISGDLRGLSTTDKPTRPKGGRPKGSGKSKDNKQSKPTKPDEAPVSANPPHAQGARVYRTDRPEVHGTVVVPGDTTTTVTFDDDPRHQSHVPNGLLRAAPRTAPADEPEPEPHPKSAPAGGSPSDEGETQAEVTAELLLDAAAIKNFSEKGKLRIEDAIRIHKARLERDFRQQVTEQVRREIADADDAFRRHYKELLAEKHGLEIALNRRAPFTKDQFQDLLKCVHPNGVMSTPEEIRNRTAQFLQENRRRLVAESETPEPQLPDDFPNTPQEWEALRAKVRAKNSERSKRAWAARKAKQAAATRTEGETTH